MCETSRGEHKAEHSLRLYVFERADGIREITGGGMTPEGLMIDICGEVVPGGGWEGFTYAELEPGTYRIEGRALIKVEERAR